MLDEVFRDWTEALPTGGSAAEHLENSPTGWIDYVAQRPSVARLILRRPPTPSPEGCRLVRAGSASVAWFQAVVDEGIASGKLDKHKREIVLMARGMPRRRRAPDPGCEDGGGHVRRGTPSKVLLPQRYGA